MGYVPKEKRNRKPLVLRGLCPKYKHFEKGEQKACNLFRLVCIIYQETAAEKFDEPRLRGYSPNHIDRIRTPCGKYKRNSSVVNPLTELGHPFYQSCIETAIKSNPKCLTCRRELFNGIT